MRTRTKSLTAEENGRARRTVQELVDTRFAGSQSRAAEAFGVSQPLLSEFLRGQKGMGGKLMRGVARYDRSIGASIYGAVEQTVSPPSDIERDGALWMLHREGVGTDEAKGLLELIEKARKASTAEEITALALLIRGREIPASVQRMFANEAKQLNQGAPSDRRRRKSRE